VLEFCLGVRGVLVVLDQGVELADPFARLGCQRSYCLDIEELSALGFLPDELEVVVVERCRQVGEEPRDRRYRDAIDRGAVLGRKLSGLVKADARDAVATAGRAGDVNRRAASPEAVQLGRAEVAEQRAICA
jgi:hypothetical protein